MLATSFFSCPLRWRSVRALPLAALSVLSLPAAFAEDRTINGSGNNLAHPTWGMANTQLLRLSPDAYGDGVSTMAGGTRPSPRLISNTIVHQTSSILNGRNMSDWVWQWGQFMDHDLDLTPVTSPAEPADIPVPPGDPVFGFPAIPFNRSGYDPATGTGPGNPRRQLNEITSWIDGSTVYGSDATTAASLRTFAGGRLAITSHATGDLLPMSAGSFLAGDPRVNEQLGLTATHTLWMREHNHWADVLSLANPGWSDDDVYQRARKIVGAEIQAVTYHEWLPTLLGDGAIPAYGGYNPLVNGSVSNEFAAALFRVGHTLLSPTLRRVDNSGNTIPEGDVALQDAFFSPSKITDEGGVEPLLKGLASQRAQEVDQHIVEDVRSFLFTIPTGGFDLAALNIQRGRDHGLADFNQMRVAFGLPALTSFSELTSDASLASLFASMYASIDDVDPWIGAISEDHVAGGSLGALLTAALVDQFSRARDGDRFWYENDPDLADLVSEIGATKLSDIIRRNTSITNIQDNVFVVPEPTSLSLVLGGLLIAGRRPRR